MSDLMKGKRGLIMGVANDKSIAWGIAREMAAQGAELAFTYQGEAFGKRVQPLAASLGSSILVDADVTDDVIQTAFGKFKILADKKKHVYDDDIAALVDDSMVLDKYVINLKSLKVFAGTGEPQKAEMTLDVYGEVKSTSETGDGPVDAIFKCIKVLYPHDVKLQLYQVHAVTEGTDAQATVSVRIEEEGKTTVGQAADTDTLVASANAYLSALNKMIIKRKKTAPMESETQKMKGI